MSMKPLFDRKGGNETRLVDKVIGNAYGVVRLVAEHLEEIKNTVTNMGVISQAPESAHTATKAKEKAEEARDTALLASEHSSNILQANQNIATRVESVGNRILGSFPEAPTYRNDGSPLEAGDWFFDTTHSEVKVYNGSVWYTPNADGQAILNDLASSDEGKGAALVGFKQAGAVARSLADKAREVVSVTDFGAVGDGVADDTAALQTAFDYSVEKGLPLVGVGGKTYLVTSPLVVEGTLNLDLNGDTIDGSSIEAGTTYNERAVLKVTGGIGSEIAVTSDLDAGSTVIDVVSTSGISAGDYILLSSNQRMVDGYGNAGSRRGELTIVKAVNSSTEIELSAATTFTYASASGAKIQVIDALHGVSIRNGTIIAGGESSRHTGLQLHYCVKPVIQELNVRGGNDVGIATFFCYGGKISGGRITDSTWKEPGDPETSGGSGYGVCLYYATRDFLIENVYFSRCTRAVTGGGTYPSLHCITRSCVAEDMTNGFGGHEPCWYWIIEDCIVRRASGFGINARGQFTKIHRCKFFDCASYGVNVRSYYVNPQGVQGTEIVDCEFIRTSGIILDGHVTDGRVVNTIIRGNRHESCKYANVTIRRADNVLIDGVLFENQTITSPTDGNAIYVGGSSAEGDQCTNITIQGVEVIHSARSGFRILFAKGVAINGCSVLQSDNDAIHLDNCEDVTVSGCRLKGANLNFTYGIRAQNCRRTTITGNIIEGKGDTSQTGNHGVVFAGNNSMACEDNIASGNMISGFSRAVYVTATTGGTVGHSIVMGNNGRLCYGASKFDTPSTGLIVVNNLA